MLKPAIASSEDLMPILAGLLNSPVEDLEPLSWQIAHRAFRARWIHADGPIPIVIRFFIGPYSAEKLRNEALALQALGRAGLPVPEVYLQVEDEKIAGAPFIVMERMPGTPLGAVLHRELDRHVFWLEKSVTVLLRLHTLLGQQTLDWLQPALNPLEFAERQVRWWSRQAQVAGCHDAAEGYSWLRLNLFQARRAEAQALVHRDLGLNNLLVQEDRISGMVSWSRLVIADPAVDVGWTRLLLSVEFAQEVGDRFAEIYQRRSPNKLESLHFWEVFAACKYLTMLTMDQKAATEQDVDGLAEGEQPPAEETAALAALDFMRQRLVDED